MKLMNYLFNKSLVFGLFAFALLVTSCQGTKDPNVAVTNVMKRNNLNSKIPVYNNIRNYVNEINAAIQELESKGPVTVERDGQNYEVRVSFKDGEPVLIYVQTPLGNQQSWYYLENRKLIMLKELGREGPTYYENEFFYEEANLLAAISRTASKSKNLPERSFKEYKAEKDAYDFRVLPNDAFASAMEFLMGR